MKNNSDITDKMAEGTAPKTNYAELGLNQLLRIAKSVLPKPSIRLLKYEIRGHPDPTFCVRFALEEERAKRILRNHEIGDAVEVQWRWYFQKNGENSVRFRNFQ